MGLEDENGPPKKKLKQAQLCFGNVSLKSQKRKLSADLNDDVHANKIVCKEIEKENVENNSKSLCAFSESRKKSELDSICRNSAEKRSTSKSENFVDLTEDAISASHNTEAEPVVKEDDKSLKDFSLVISDSVLNTINNKSVEGESNTNSENPKDESSSGVKDSSPNGLSNHQLESDSAKDDSADKAQPIDEVLSRSFNSEDDFALSSEESPKTKSSPGTAARKLTAKRLEALQKREEKDRKKLEKKLQKNKEKEEKQKKRLEKEELRRKEKEEKERKRLAEQKIKEEEKRLKEEEKKKKEEERKLKDEERKQKEEEKRRKEEAKEEEKRKKEEMTEKEKAAFANFFIPKKKSQTDVIEKQKESEEEVKFMPFPVKPDMRLAINPRRVMSNEDKETLDNTILGTSEKSPDLYLKELKTGAHLPQKSEATWPVVSQEEEHDVIIIESTADGECIDLTNSKVVNNKKKMKAKLLQFHDNRRPPYWGTWRKKSSFVGPRKPLGQDKKTFDYEVDSDSEWEDEGEGEDIDKAGDSDEEQGEEEENQNSGENGYLLDNTFVPHGYLSDEEVHPDEEVDNDPENLKLRMKLLKQEFDEEMKSKTERLKPRLLGCVWISNGTTEVSSGSLYETLLRFRAVWNEEGGSIDMFGPDIEESPTSIVQTKCKPFPVAVLPVLAKFVHGNNLPLSGLVREFLLVLEKECPTENITKRAISLKIKEIAAKTYDSSGKSVWAVNVDMCKEYGLTVINNSKSSAPPTPIPEKPKESLLVNFLKGTQTPQPVKKRVALIPVPSANGTPVRKENEKTAHVATPRPTVANVVKKRAQLITLSSTPETAKTVSSVHIDTPRPSHVPSKVHLETVDISTDST